MRDPCWGWCGWPSEAPSRTTSGLSSREASGPIKWGIRGSSQTCLAPYRAPVAVWSLTSAAPCFLPRISLWRQKRPTVLTHSSLVLSLSCVSTLTSVADRP